MNKEERAEIAANVVTAIDAAAKGKPYVCIIVDTEAPDEVPFIISCNMPVWNAMGTLMQVGASMYQAMTIEALAEQADEAGPAN